MSLAEEDQENVEYWSRAGTTSGRWRLNLRFWRKRFLWRFVVGGTQVLKRITDTILAACALLVLSPVFAITSLLIKLEDGGSIFFQQNRIAASVTSLACGNSAPWCPTPIN
ncbi:MAG: sugar transferase [Candidatus Synoicihabitans palmerolidicus]|nr:sugar transferase [Candidatus Synoicihabitans palmerolidicus]